MKATTAHCLLLLTLCSSLVTAVPRLAYPRAQTVQRNLDYQRHTYGRREATSPSRSRRRFKKRCSQRPLGATGKGLGSTAPLTGKVPGPAPGPTAPSSSRTGVNPTGTSPSKPTSTPGDPNSFSCNDPVFQAGDETQSHIMLWDKFAVDKALAPIFPKWKTVKHDPTYRKRDGTGWTLCTSKDPE